MWSCGTLTGSVFEGDGIECGLVAQDAVDGLQDFAGDVAEGDFAGLLHDFFVLVVAVFEGGVGASDEGGAVEGGA